MKNFGKIMLIIGTVIGSGFASGKEIAVFFSRFGWYSYLFIPLVFLLFFGVFFWVLSYGKRGVDRLTSSRFFLVMSVVVSLVFTSSMFAGTTKTMDFGNQIINVFLISLLLFVCAVISQKGLKALAKINTYLVPFLIAVLLCCLVSNIGWAKPFQNGSFLSGGLFACLYVVMNISTSSIVMGQLGQGMSKKTILLVSFFASFILSVLLFAINFVLLGNEGSLNFSMPLLDMSKGAIYVMMRIVIFLGCLTTLLSLVYTVSQALVKLKIKGFLNILISVVLPFSASFIGFGQIVSLLYPIVSVLGIFMLVPFFPWEKFRFSFDLNNLKKH